LTNLCCDKIYKTNVIVGSYYVIYATMTHLESFVIPVSPQQNTYLKFSQGHLKQGHDRGRQRLKALLINVPKQEVETYAQK